MRKGKEDWLGQGIEILNTEGLSKLTIENLCSMLNVTKGSFYHHFRNMEGYIESLMEYWLDKYTYAFISELEKVYDPKQKKAMLYDMAISAPHKNEQHIRAWSFYNDTVKTYQRKVDDIRLHYLEELGIELGMDQKKAHYFAMTEYAILVGLQQLFPDMDNVEHEDIMKIVNLKIN